MRAHEMSDERVSGANVSGLSVTCEYEWCEGACYQGEVRSSEVLRPLFSQRDAARDDMT